MKVKVGVERFWRTLNTITKNLSFIKYIERRNHKVSSRGMIY